MQVTVKLSAREGAAHVSGILAGFTLLAKRGELTLRVQDERQGSPLAREALLETEIDGRTVVFDLMDGYFYNDPAAVLALFQPGRCGVQTFLFSREEPAVPGRYLRKAAAIGAELLRYLSGLAAGSGAQRKEPPEAVGAFHPLLPAGL